MEDRMIGRYWCYMCSQMVNPRVEPDMKCPFCGTGFLEELTNVRHYSNDNDTDMATANSLSLWAPILLGLIGGLGSAQLRIVGRDQSNDSNSQQDNELEDELGREFDSLFMRRGSGSALRVLQDMRNIAGFESDNSENGRERSGRMILFDPFNNEALIVQGSFGGQNSSPSPRASGSFGDYLMGSGWDLLLQFLTDNDSNRYGTPPTQKEAVDSMPTITLGEIVQCSICLEDIDIGSEAKEMPCKHKFHGDCIVPWLELHSSCPVCRYQMPSDDSKTDASVNRNGNEGRTTSTDNDAQTGGRVGTGRRYWIPIPWPYEGLLTLPAGSPSDSTPAPSSAALPGSQSDSTSDPSSAAMPGSADASQTD